MSVRRFYISKQRRTTLPVKSNVTISFVNSEGENSLLTRRSFYRGLTVTFQSKQIFCYCPFIVWNVPVLATFLNVQISIWRREQIIDAANIVWYVFFAGSCWLSGTRTGTYPFIDRCQVFIFLFPFSSWPMFLPQTLIVLNPCIQRLIIFSDLVQSSL